MTKKILFIAALSFSISSLAQTIYCPSENTIKTVHLMNGWIYQAIQNNLTWSSAPTPTIDKTNIITYFTTAMIFPNTGYNPGDMSCHYNSTNNPYGVTLWQSTSLKPNLNIANAWKTPLNNGVYYCAVYQNRLACPALTQP